MDKQEFEQSVRDLFAERKKQVTFIDDPERAIGLLMWDIEQKSGGEGEWDGDIATSEYLQFKQILMTDLSQS